MAVPAANSRECTCVDDFDLDEDETLIRCAHYRDWKVVLIETVEDDGLGPMWSVQSNVLGWGELFTLSRKEAEEGFAFAESRFHEDGA